MSFTFYEPTQRNKKYILLWDTVLDYSKSNNTYIKEVHSNCSIYNLIEAQFGRMAYIQAYVM